MLKIYIDTEYRCHTSNDGTMREVQTDFFDSKCQEYIEGYRFVPTGEAWTREVGTVFHGEMITPWKPWEELDKLQREYEREQYAAMAAELADAREALEILGVTADE